MKIRDIETINRLIARLGEVRQMIVAASSADATDFELFIERPGDGSIRMSREGASSTHFQGFGTSEGFLEGLRALALAEFRAREAEIKAELAAFGVEDDEGAA